MELTRQVKPVVIIMEAELPGTIRGWEAVRALRADREICNIPVIICSWLQEANVDALVGEVAGHLQSRSCSTRTRGCPEGSRRSDIGLACTVGRYPIF